MRHRAEPHLFYDRIAWHYDRWESSTDKRFRRLAAERLALRAGDVVLVPGCGTGLDLPPLVAAVGSHGRVIGLDYSKGMLRRAQAMVERNGWTNVALIHEDARALSAALLRERAGITEVDGLFFSNVHSIVPDWEAVFERGFSLLRKGGRRVIYDGRPAAGTARVLNPILYAFAKLGRGNIRRRVGELLNGHVDDLRLSYTRIPDLVSRVLASGVKR